MGRCIVCGRRLPRATTTYLLRLPQEAVAPASRSLFLPNGCPAMEVGDRFAHRDNLFTLVVAEYPTTKEQAVRLVNGTITHLGRSKATKAIESIVTWDGESYARKWFCTDRCAVAQGHASAHFGHRFKWKDDE